VQPGDAVAVGENAGWGVKGSGIEMFGGGAGVADAGDDGRGVGGARHWCTAHSPETAVEALPPSAARAAGRASAAHDARGCCRGG
jgi:hypothetical protein